MNLLIPLIVFLGFPIGIFLSKLSPEEMKTGKKYFHLIQNFLLVFILFFIFNYYNINILLIILTTIVIFSLSFYWENTYKSTIIYLILAIILFLSSKNTQLFEIESSLMFIFGIPTGSSYYKIKKPLKIILINFSFVILATLLLFLF